MPIQQITTGIIADGAVVATDIANGTVTGPKLGANSVSSNNIIAGVTLTTPIISGNLNLDSTGTTGVRVPSANTLAFYEGGVEAMRINSSGQVGIGTASPDRPLVVASTSDAMTIAQSGGGVGLQITNSTVNDALLRMTNSSGHYWDLRSQGTGSNFLIGGFFGDTLRLGTTGNLQFNSGYGSVATAYGCRAWVNFYGDGTPGIRGSGNVSSITDNGVGDYTVNYTTALVDNNYSVVSMGGRNPDGSGGERQAWNYADRYSTTSVRIQVTQTNGNPFDQPSMFVAVFR
jgi:hypothetical protein